MHRPLLGLTVLLALSVSLTAQGRDRKRAAKPKPAAAVAQAATEAQPPPPQQQVATRGPTRIDFDDRLIQGQTNAAGSVYLYDRKQLPLSPMVKKRESFLRDLVAVLGN
jgi:hypothetical protein